MKEYFSGDAFRKRVFSFASNNRGSLEAAELDAEISLRAKNEQGEEIEIPFRVTRNAHLGKKTRWIYGEVLAVPDDEYYQIEIKLHRGQPEMDTIEVFPHAPPKF